LYSGGGRKKPAVEEQDFSCTKPEGDGKEHALAFASAQVRPSAIPKLGVDSPGLRDGNGPGRIDAGGAGRERRDCAQKVPRATGEKGRPLRDVEHTSAVSRDICENLN
jgi:hypothetical protein